ncbi:AraC family transcriptional regulator [Actinosynnema sp. NPDC050801]|uniref:AraC family transcriptional regulator n=1 Tax=unclassified Actinosynnema TaxID=2637065 RepID=UPI0033C13B05
MRERPPFDLVGTLLRHVRVDASRFGRVELGAPWGARMDARDTTSLHHVLDGELWLDVDGRRVHVRAGDLVVLPHGASHSLRHRPDAQVTAHDTDPTAGGLSVRRRFGGDGARTVMLCAELTLSGAAKTLFLRALPPVVHLRPASSGDPVPGLGRLLDGLREEVRDDRPGASLVATRLVEVVLVQGIRAELERPAEAGSWRAALADDRIGRALDALYDAPERPWTVAVLARAAGMSRAAFATRFRELLGETPIAHLTRWRMDLARTVLRERPELSVGQVATAVGYRSEYAFNAAFRRVVGTPPGRYRTGGT